MNAPSRDQSAVMEAELVLEPALASRAVDAPFLPNPSPSAAPAADLIAPEMVEEKSVWPTSWPLRIWWGFCAVAEWSFGFVSLVAFLAAVSVIPLAQLAALGYLLEASGRVARSGRLGDGFIDIWRYARIGSLIAGTWLMLLPVRFVSGLALDAEIASGGTAVAAAWRVGLVLLTIATVGHILLAWYSGGKLRHFFWPLLAPFQFGMRILFGGVVGPLVRPLVRAVSPKLEADLYQPRPLNTWFPPAIVWERWRVGGFRGMFIQAREAVWDFVVGLQLPHYFWLGLRGFLGAFAWLAVPVALLSVGTFRPGPGPFLVGWLGAFLLAIVLLYLPFLQANFARTGNWRDLFAVGEVRRLFVRAPLAFWSALLLTYLFAILLYVFKVEPPPKPLLWTLSPFFIALIFPARLLTGWALSRAVRRKEPTWTAFCMLARFAAIPVVLFYLLVLFFTQYTSWNGAASLFFEQHAFSVPAPFLGL